MAVSYRFVCEKALSFPEVTEGITFGTPSLHVGRTLLARMKEDGQTLALKVAMEQRADYFELAPDTFFITDHYKNSPLILIDLASVRVEVMTKMIENAWRMIAPPKLVKAYDAALKGKEGSL